MDDTTLYARSRENMQKILDTAMEFLKINDITANGEKSSLVCIHAKKQDREEGVYLANTQVLPLPKNQATRILGVWITEDGKKQYQKELIREKTHTYTSIMSWKKITDKQARYIINHVLYPAIEYLLNDMVLSEQECNKISGKINKVFKHKAGLPSTTPNSIIHADFGYKLFNLWDRQILLHGNNWVSRMNGHDTCSITTQIRLQQLQNKYWAPTSVCQNKLPFWSQKKNNLTNKLLNMLKVQGITFSLTNHMTIGIPPQGGNIFIKEITEEGWYHRNRTSLAKKELMF